jgi:hypothetical protein
MSRFVPGWKRLEVTMLSTQTLKNAARPLQWIATIAQFVLGRVKRVAIAIVHRRNIEVLARFDDRMLADIGLTRNDLRFVFGEPFWRDPFPLLARYAGERRAAWRHPGGNDPTRVAAAPSIVPEAPARRAADAGSLAA